MNENAKANGRRLIATHLAMYREEIGYLLLPIFGFM